MSLCPSFPRPSRGAKLASEAMSASTPSATPSPTMPSSKQARAFRILGHRGASSERPENTLPAFARALEVGADGLELDVQATQDGVVVVSHDPDAERTAGVPKPFSDVTYAEVAAWDAGWGFVAPDGSRPFAGQGIRIARLEEVLEAFPHATLNIDLKAPVAESAVALIRHYKAQARVCLASFRISTLTHVRCLGYEGETSLSRAEAIRFLFTPACLQTGRLRPVAQAAQLPDLLGTAYVVKKCHRVGLRAEYWTINDPARALVLAALGADGVITDDPAAMVAALRGSNA